MGPIQSVDRITASSFQTLAKRMRTRTAMETPVTTTQMATVF